MYVFYYRSMNWERIQERQDLIHEELAAFLLLHLVACFYWSLGGGRGRRRRALVNVYGHSRESTNQSMFKYFWFSSFVLIYWFSSSSKDHMAKTQSREMIGRLYWKMKINYVHGWLVFRLTRSITRVTALLESCHQLDTLGFGLLLHIAYCNSRTAELVRDWRKPNRWSCFFSWTFGLTGKGIRAKMKQAPWFSVSRTDCDVVWFS